MRKRGEVLQAELVDVLQAADGPLSAYDILDALRPANPKIAPPTVYRALKALQEQGRIHRLESMNTYMLCQCDAHDQETILSICDDCGTVEETVAPDVLKKMSRVVEKSGFAVARHVIEVHGRCADCGPEQSTS